MSTEKMFYYHHRKPVTIKNKQYLFTFCGIVSSGYLLRSSRMSIGVSACNLTLEKNWNRKEGNGIAKLRATVRPIREFNLDSDSMLINKELYNTFLMHVDNIILRQGLDRKFLHDIAFFNK